MTKEKKPDITHEDRLGRIISLDSKVAVAYHNNIQICSVVKLNPKMITVSPVNTSYNNAFRVYSMNTIVIDGEDVLLYILKGNKG